MRLSVNFSKDAKNTKDASRSSTLVDVETGQEDSHGSDDEQLANIYTSRRASVDFSSHLHMLTSYKPGESKVEKLARKITERVEERVPVTFPARKAFLKHCRVIARSKGYDKLSRIKLRDLLEYRDRVKAEVEENNALHFLGILNHKVCLMEMLDKANEITKNVELEPDDWFHYQDFNFFHSVLVSKWPWMRHDTLFAAGLVFLFYFFTPILFCVIMKSDGVCPQNTKVPGWVSALYFASTTMSTVGYGDLSVEKDEPWKIFIGCVYMIIAILVGLTAFSAAADTALSPLKFILNRLSLKYPEGPLEEGEYLYQRIRKIKLIMLCDILLQFVVLNLIGVFASHVFADNTDVVERQWDWMESFYWAVQTTTTIGYGDLSMPVRMRWFQIFYLSLATYLVGNALGKLATLKHDIEEIRAYHAWQRRDVNKHMMHYLASTEDPTKVDQYEFLIASLLNLGKIKYEDVEPIMDKFRKLAKDSGNSGYIQVAQMQVETEMTFEELEKVEGVVDA